MHWTALLRNIEQLYEVSTPCVDDHHLKKQELETVGKLFKSLLSHLSDMLWFGAHRQTIFCGLWTNQHEQSRSGLEPVTDAWLVWFLTFTARVISGSIVIWETPQNRADWDCFKTELLPETLKTPSQHQEEFCAFSEVEPLFQSVGCARSRGSLTQFHRVRGHIFRRWFTHGRYHRSGFVGFRLLKGCIITIILGHGETRCIAFIVWKPSENPKEVETSHVGRKLLERLITSLRTQNFLTIILFCTLLRTLTQWSRWSLKAQVQWWEMFLEPTKGLLTGSSTESIWTSKSVNSTPHRVRSCTQESFSHAHCLSQEPTRSQRRFSVLHKTLCYLPCSPRCVHIRNNPHFPKCTPGWEEQCGRSAFSSHFLTFLLLTTTRRTLYPEDPVSAHRPHAAMHLRSPCGGVTVGDNAANVWHVRCRHRSTKKATLARVAITPREKAQHPLHSQARGDPMHSHCWGRTSEKQVETRIDRGTASSPATERKLRDTSTKNSYRFASNKLDDSTRSEASSCGNGFQSRCEPWWAKVRLDRSGELRVQPAGSEGGEHRRKFDRRTSSTRCRTLL